jgi:membrane protein DedA with SNARE-associated domain
MNDALPFLIRHGYAVLFLSVLAEQLGLPLPATPFIIAAGALAHLGQMNFAVAVLLATLASVLADLSWYQIGRLRGVKVLHVLCRISLEPDYCVRRTENSFTRHGAKTLLIAKFVPGVSTVAPPLAGINHSPLARFLIYDGAGALLWVGSFMLLGFLFSDQLEQVINYTERFGTLGVIVLIALVFAWIGWKYVQRRRFLRSLRIARIMPQQLKVMMDRGDEVFVVDLRHAIDLEDEPRTIPGALRLPAEELEQRADELPLDRELVLFCT